MKIPWRKVLLGELSWKRLLSSLVLIYGVLVLLAFFFSERLIFPYRGSSYGEDLPGLHKISGPDGQEIATRYLRARNEAFLVLHFHGNYEDLGHLDPIYEILRERRFSILAMDYRGYGLSQGTPTENRCYQDALLLYQRALELGYQPEQLILWGRSVGSGLAVELARQKEARALVLESPFSTAFRTATRIPLVPFDKFHNLKKMESLEEPLFILHGDRDTVIPAWHSAKLHQRHRGPKERHLIPGAGHNDLWSFDLDPVLMSLEEFLAAPTPPEPR